MIQNLESSFSLPAVKELPQSEVAAKANPARRQKNSVQQSAVNFDDERVRPSDLSARIISSHGDLEKLRPSWSRLMRTCIRPNPFFAPEFLLPAIRHFGQDVQVVAVEAPSRARPDGPPILCGLVPVVQRRVRLLPFRWFEIWDHPQCFDCTPLLRAGCAGETLDCMLNGIREGLGAKLLSLNTVNDDDAFGRLLTDAIYSQRMFAFHREQFSRACLRPSASAEEYVRMNVSKNTRKETKRAKRKLAQQGDLQIEWLTGASSLEAWTDDFLKVEHSGWKGREGTSLKSNPAEEAFFREMTHRMFERNQLGMVRISLDGRTISILCDVQCSDGEHSVAGAAYKTAFDEDFAKFSPGLVAELENVTRLHHGGLKYVDSCSSPDHPMINRVWSGRTRFRSLVLALDQKGWMGRLSRLAVACFPMLQAIKQTIRFRAR